MLAAAGSCDRALLPLNTITEAIKTPAKVMALGRMLMSPQIKMKLD
jgi:hypothetical protein